MIERFFRCRLKEECVWHHNFAGFREALATISQGSACTTSVVPISRVVLSPHQYRARQLQAVA